jgi:hypothetical protein
MKKTYLLSISIITLLSILPVLSHANNGLFLVFPAINFCADGESPEDANDKLKSGLEVLGAPTNVSSDKINMTHDPASKTYKACTIVKKNGEFEKPTS